MPLDNDEEERRDIIDIFGPLFIERQSEYLPGIQPITSSRFISILFVGWILF
jgi:hypothetical protein